jgi:hypothetical protein
VLTVTFYLESIGSGDRNQTAWVGWKAFEALGVEPVFPEKYQSIDYAQNRACFRSGEVRILDSTGNIERVIPFDEANRKL